MEGDGEAWYAYYALHRFHWKPSEFAALPFDEKAMVIAMIRMKIEQDKKDAARRNKA